MISLRLENQGEVLTFFGPADSTAPSVEVELRLAPGAAGPEMHMHPQQSETFQVVSGRLTVVVEGDARVAEPGETVTVAPGQRHSFSNGSDSDELVARVTVAPALHFQWFLTESAASAIRGGGRWKDMSLLEAGYILNQVPDEYRLAGVPALVQRLLFRLLATVAVLTGKAGNVAPIAPGPPAGRPVDSVGLDAHAGQ